MSKRILFVEDEPNLQKTLSKILEDENYEIIHALDGELGISLAKKEKPDLVLLDLVLPKKAGFEVLQELKSDPETKEIPVIVLTNLENTQDVEKAIELGATTYLVKSNYGLEEILKKVEAVLQK